MSQSNPPNRAENFETGGNSPAVRTKLIASGKSRHPSELVNTTRTTILVIVIRGKNTRADASTIARPIHTSFLGIDRPEKCQQTTA